jgi:hypothetical protein
VWASSLSQAYPPSTREDYVSWQTQYYMTDDRIVILQAREHY